MSGADEKFIFHARTIFMTKDTLGNVLEFFFKKEEERSTSGTACSSKVVPHSSTHMQKGFYTIDIHH
jgi:hypothetical protein